MYRTKEDAHLYLQDEQDQLKTKRLPIEQAEAANNVEEVEEEEAKFLTMVPIVPFCDPTKRTVPSALC